MNGLVAALKLANKEAEVQGAIGEAELYLSAERGALVAIEGRTVEAMRQFDDEYVARRARIDELEQVWQTLNGFSSAIRLASNALIAFTPGDLSEEAEAEVCKLLSMECEPAMTYAGDIEDMLEAADES